MSRFCCWRWCWLFLVASSAVVIGVRSFNVEENLDLDELFQDENPESSRAAFLWRREMGFTPRRIQQFHSPCFEYSNEQCARLFLQEFDRVISANLFVTANLTFHQLMDMKNKVIAKMSSRVEEKAEPVTAKAKREMKRFQYKLFSPNIRRQFHYLRRWFLQTAVNDKQSRLLSQLSYHYSAAPICPKGLPSCLGSGEYPISEYMLHEHNYDKLSAAWQAWNDVLGTKLKPIYTEFVKLTQIGAQERGDKDASHRERIEEWDAPNLESIVLELMEELIPLYREMHAYVRARLRQHYPDRFAADDPIPAHILGNIWSQQWQNIFPLVAPYVEKPDFEDVDAALQSKTVPEMVRLAESFFTSMGLPPMTKEFWKYSVFEKAPHKVMDCHPSSLDLFNGVDFRMSMCGTRSRNTFKSLHHEMGHIQYFMSYAPLPIAFRNSPNMAFHEAVGDTIALSVMTPQHLVSVGLLAKHPSNNEFDINFLMKIALEKVALLPFALIVDLWRWRVFNGTIPEERYNSEWWKLRMELQGIMPPVVRNETTADALFKHHVVHNIAYIRYFLGYILQFQMYEALCNASGHEGALHRCDFYESKSAGTLLSSMMSMGRRVSLEEALQILTGQRRLSTRALLRYFRPLHEWLEKENRRLKVPVGWRIRSDLIVSS